jgi:O-antigen ligase
LATAVGTYSFVQSITGVNWFRPHHPLAQAWRSGFRATGFFSQALTMAYVLGISIAFLLPQFRRLRSKHLLLGAIVLASLGLFASLSRGSWIAMCVVVFVFAYQEWGKKALLGLIPATVLFFGLFTFSTEFHDRIMDLFNTNTVSSGGERVDIWAGYWQVFKDHPVVGAGLFYGDEYLPEVYKRLGIEQTFVSHAHNNYLQALAGTGILGFIFFALFNFYFLRLAYTLYKEHGPSALGRLAQGAFLAQTYWQLGGLTECNFFDGEVNHMIVFTWALLLAIKATAKPH